MLQSLRIRLTLSHTLPVLIVVPLLGLGLLYQLEQRLFLNIARELAVQGILIAHISDTDAQLWQDPTRAANLLNTLQQQVPAQMEFVDGVTLADAGATVSTQPEASDSTAEQLTMLDGTELDKSLLAQVHQGQVVWTIHTDRNSERAINVIVPVTDNEGNVMGAVHLMQRITDLQERINSLRILVLVTLLAGALCSVLLGLLLARSIGTPLLNLSDVVTKFQPTAESAPVPETGPTEIKTLAISFNHLSRRLYELERTRTLLLSGIVHEIGRPLGAMRVAAQTIAAGSSLQTAQELANGISQHIDRLQLQLDDLV
ncbi:MAG: sensor histidine kinase, partial [Caldilineaceae bacterium]|nr:sensor histidine kinase [Caldilineaceae bacterium]